MSKNIVRAAVGLSLAAVLVIPGLASAANTTDSSYHAKFTMSSKAFETGYRSKTNKSKVYLRVDHNNVSSGVRLSAWGAHDDAGTGTSNVTVNAYKYLDKGQTGKFSLSNNVRELGFSYAEIYIEALGYFGGEIHGVWSPDSTRNYTVLSQGEEE